MNNAFPSAMPPMIDTHCHLDDHQFAHDLEHVLQRSREANVTRWILIGYDPERWDHAIDFASRHEGMSHTLGVHPACARAWNDDTELRLRELLQASGARGVGEAGLDFYRDNAPYDIQARTFSAQLEMAANLNLPIVIHMRAAEDEILHILSDGRSLPTLIFHSFDGSEKLMDFVLATGSYVGIGGLATRQGSTGLRSLLTNVPMEQILLETDSPYLVPARQKDRRNQPVHIATIASLMAEVLGTDPLTLAAQATMNAERVFGLADD
jgi:TatD DNase family protein